MKPPRIPPMVLDIVQTAICSFDNTEFTSLAACPVCGGPVQGYDTREKRYAVIREGNGERAITVKVKRFMCRNCNTLCNADEPFYPGTRTGSLVIDLYFSISSTMPGCRAARFIDAMGIVVDRTTWRNYYRKDYPDVPLTDVFKIHLPVSAIFLSTMITKFSDGDRNKEAEMLAACGFPSAGRTGAWNIQKVWDKKKKLQPGIPMASSESA